MRAFNLTRTSTSPSYENAIQAGSLAATGNSFRPIGAPAKRVSNPVAKIVQPPSYPVANPVTVTPRMSSFQFSTPAVPVAHPVLHTPSIRGIFGQ